jgi:hypothetical protein
MDITSPSVDVKFDENQLRSIEAAKNIVTNLQAESVRLAKVVQVHEADVKEAVVAKDALLGQIEALKSDLEALEATKAEVQATLALARESLDITTAENKAIRQDSVDIATTQKSREDAIAVREIELRERSTELSLRAIEIRDRDAEVTRKENVLKDALTAL